MVATCNSETSATSPISRLFASTFRVDPQEGGNMYLRNVSILAMPQRKERININISVPRNPKISNLLHLWLVINKKGGAAYEGKDVKNQWDLFPM
jgi:hypothetical protein